MKKQSLITILLTVLMSMTGAKAFAHNIEVPNKNGVTIYYVWANEAKTELAVSWRGAHNNEWFSEYSGNVVIPSSVVYKGITYSVTSIGEYAFSDCNGLTSVTIPNSVTSIGERAFYSCSGLTSVTIGNSVKSIGEEAFIGCSALTSVTIPNSVTFIGEQAFLGCSGLTSIKVESGNGKYDSRNNCNAIIETSSNTLIAGCMNTSIPNSVTSIGDYAFYGCSGLNSVTIPNGVTSIGLMAFYYCKGLTSVTIGNSVTTIGGSAFYSCTGLTSITIPNSVTSIGTSAFLGCKGLISIVIGSGVTSIGASAFYDTNLKKTIWLTNTPPSGYNYASGSVNYVSNDQFSFSNQVKYQFLSSYFEADGIRYVPVSPSERTCDAIDCVYDESAASIKIASTVAYKGVTMSVKNIQPYLAYNNKYIQTLSVDYDGELPNYAFSQCSNMQSITLGQKLSAIGNYALEGCSSLKAVTIPGIVKTLGDYCFSGCSSLNSITIPSAVTTIKNYVFSNCTSLAKVIISDSESTLTLGSNYSNPIFSSCPLDYVYIGRDISYQTGSSKGYSPFYRNTSLRAVKITDKEKEISDNEFYGCTNLQQVEIGDGVTSIGNWAFSGCSSLKYFAFGSQVTNIGQEAFSDCTAVTEITSLANTPPACGSQALDDINKWECKLFVPKGCQTAYGNAEQWKDFFFMEEGVGTLLQAIVGDANGDGKVNAADIVEMVNAKNGKASAIFNLQNADMDGNNEINQADIDAVVNIIMSQE